MNTEELQSTAKRYLTTFQQDTENKEKFFVPIQFDSYQDLGYTIENISNVCINYLFAKENNMLLTDNLFDVINLLEIQKQSIPFSEMEYLDKIKEQF